MKRIYYAFLPLNTSRPGGAWWYRDMNELEIPDFVEALRPTCTALRISHSFPLHDFMHIAPPTDAEVVI